jgi:hypothetical protein
MKPHIVDLALQGAKTCFPPRRAKAFAVSQLRESHRQILVPAREIPQASVPIVTGDRTTELSIGKEGNQLRKNGSARIHEPL